MVIDKNDEKLKTLKQIKEFMAGTEGVEFTHQPDRDTRYQHISDVLCRLRYYALGKADRGVRAEVPQADDGVLPPTGDPARQEIS